MTDAAKLEYKLPLRWEPVPGTGEALIIDANGHNIGRLGAHDWAKQLCSTLGDVERAAVAIDEVREEAISGTWQPFCRSGMLIACESSSHTNSARLSSEAK